MKNYCLLFIVIKALWALPASADTWQIPDRHHPRPETTAGIPHIQIDVEAVPELSEALLQRVSDNADIELHNTIVGRSGSTGFWLQESAELARPSSIIRGREFAHLHPDGSLHASLPPELATLAVEKGWAIHHPWANTKPGLRGFVMIYTPLSEAELDVVSQLVMASYRFVAGIESSSAK